MCLVGKMDWTQARKRFEKVYAKLPPCEVDNVCCIIEEEPISWRLAWNYIATGSTIKKKILNKLVELELI